MRVVEPRFPLTSGQFGNRDERRRKLLDPSLRQPDEIKNRALTKFREIGTVRGAVKAAGFRRSTWYD